MLNYFGQFLAFWGANLEICDALVWLNWQASASNE